jgi:hypothetical protein
MSKLAEIEQAADALSANEKQELMLFLAVRLRAEPPAVRPSHFHRLWCHAAWHEV